MDMGFLLHDRMQKIKQVIEKYGQENFYVAFSGGKDSTVLSALIDMALPGNKIPRVYANTGIELNKIVEFVRNMQASEHPWDLVILTPKRNIRTTLQEVGYPFKSKFHAKIVDTYQRNGITKVVKNYLQTGDNLYMEHICPKILRYQFTDEFTLKVSDKCCEMLKEKPLSEYAKENKKPIAITGLMRSEGGRREATKCLSFRNNKLYKFNPLATSPQEFVNWCVQEYNISICELYKSPYNFKRTGCKGCPFALELQYELTKLSELLPKERRQCETIWKPVYDEYRRIGYRLKKELSLSDSDFDEIINTI